MGSGSFTDTFYQNTDKFQESGEVLHPPHPRTCRMGDVRLLKKFYKICTDDYDNNENEAIIPM